MYSQLWTVLRAQLQVPRATEGVGASGSAQRRHFKKSITKALGSLDISRQWMGSL